MTLDIILKAKIGTFFHEFGGTQARVDNLLSKVLNQSRKLLTEVQNKYANPSAKVSQKECEDYKNQIDALTKQKNILNNILNFSNKNITIFLKFLDSINITLQIISKIILVLSVLPVPVVQGMPVAIILKLSQILQKNREVFERASLLIQQATKAIASSIRGFNEMVKLALAAIDANIGQIRGILADKGATCITNSDIKVTLLEETGSNIIGSYKGFTFILKEENNVDYQVGVIKRNYAAGLDKQGVELLRSEASFASDPQILIEELKFIIDRDNLKAE